MHNKETDKFENEHSVSGSELSGIVSTSMRDFDVPENIEVCPYCKSKLSATVESCELHDDGLRASGIITECHGEPHMEANFGKDWDDWFKKHSHMPYVYQLPVDNKIIDWINKHFRFTDEC